MNAKRYLAMLEDYAHDFISTWDNYNDLIFMQGPPPFASPVRAWYDTHFLGRWLGRPGPLEWLSRSTDLTYCDFFIWGWVKNEVYRIKPKTFDEWEGRIHQVFANVPQKNLPKYVANIPNVCEN